MYASRRRAGSVTDVGLDKKRGELSKHDDKLEFTNRVAKFWGICENMKIAHLQIKFENQNFIFKQAELSVRKS